MGSYLDAESSSGKRRVFNRLGSLSEVGGVGSELLGSGVVLDLWFFHLLGKTAQMFTAADFWLDPARCLCGRCVEPRMVAFSSCVSGRAERSLVDVVEQ